MTVDAGNATSMRYDAPDDLAHTVAALPRPMLIGLDIDGVLAPIVAHADQSRLLPGVDGAVARLAAIPGVTVAAVSGRSLASIRTFGLPSGIRLVGSHGMEEDGGPAIELDDTEHRRLVELTSLADDAADEAGDGAWVEHKTASVVLHVREADTARADDALDRLAARVADVDGATAKPGSRVLELFARSASKGEAMSRLAAELGAVTAVFVGDDVTDEEAFAALGDGDVAIKVGEADTIAPHRLADPPAVLAFIEQTARLVREFDG